ncbi:MAG: hypothetical protein JXA81_08845 [Sedimentisphaerales bacterium]|nr:hypothetical protein [Sedimentisphaerales bacterium]
MKKKDIWISLAIIACSGLSVLYYTQRKGYVSIDAGGTDAVLQLNSIWFINTTIRSGTKPSAIGARIYRPQLLSLSMKQDGYTWRIESRGSWGDISKIKVKNNEATALKLGPPFLIKPKIKKNRSHLSIDFTITGQAGEQYQNFITKNNRAVNGAKIKIVDEKGNVLESGKFKYG